MMIRKKQIMLFVFLFITTGTVHAAGLVSCRGGIIISREIKPFIQMAEGVEDSLDIPLCRVFFDKDAKPYSLDMSFYGVDRAGWDFVVAIGPAALKYLMKNKPGIPVFYGMVLNPEKYSARPDTILCGVSLNLFTRKVITKIKTIVPGMEKWAVLFNPLHNTIAPDVLKAMETIQGIEPLPVEIYSESQITKALEQSVKKADLIYFIPDATLISPAVVRYIIKYGLARSIPVIGYNRFFHKSGALLSVAVDYQKSGRKLASFINRYLESGQCADEGPDTTLLFNQKAAELIDFPMEKEMIKKWSK